MTNTWRLSELRQYALVDKEKVMRKIFLCFLALTLSTAAYCQEMSQIELTDGSIIKGKVVSLDNGIYTIDAQSIGKITIGASRIRKIETGNRSSLLATDAVETTNPEASSQINTYTAKIMSNPDILKITTELASDPQFQAIMKDPQVMRAIYAGDMQTLMLNPKFMSVINNPKIEKIKDKLDQ